MFLRVVLEIDHKNEPEDSKLVNEIFFIDPQTNQVHSIIRQMIPEGDQDVNELAIEQLKQHFEDDETKMSSEPEVSKEHEILLNLDTCVSIAF
jgi:hypothetical protein